MRKRKIEPTILTASARRLMPTRRRLLLQWPLAVAAAGYLPRVAAQDGAQRLALVIGNRQYPTPHDLPPIHKNVRDVKEALEKRGFTVTSALDLDVAQTRRAIEDFVRVVQAAPPDAVAFFYFSGHGVQVDAENLLVSAGINPTGASESIVKGSIVLGPDIVGRLPKRPLGLTMVVLDACRTDLRASTKAGDGLNQVEAPPGCLIAFSTGAGKPALAPAAETQNTFYTAALVGQLHKASDELTFSDLFRLAKLETERTMLNFPVVAIRKWAQYPFIAENTRPVLLAQRRAELQSDPAKRFGSDQEARDWEQLQATIWPPEVRRLAQQFLERYPDSKLVGGALVAQEGAKDAAEILKRSDIRLYRRSFEPSPGTDAGYLADLLKSGRGDKDAAARIGYSLRTSATSGAELSRYEGWMQYASELGNGIASYELALHYRRIDQPQPAARWEARARELGYTPPPSLDNSRK
jgi:hypothetical protein